MSRYFPTPWIVGLSPQAIVACILLFFVTGTLTGQEWTRFRGPNGSGVVGGSIPAEWKEADLAWKAELPAKGHSSPVVWGDRIFLTGADRDSGARIVFALDTQGKLLWSQQFPSSTHHIHQQNSFASSTPTCDAESIYTAWATPDGGLLVALDHNGKERWRYKLPGYHSKHGFGSSPILVNDTVILTNDQDGPSSLFGIDRRTGQRRWEVERKVKTDQNASYATPLVWQPAENAPVQVLIASWGHGLSSHDPENGAILWEREIFPRRPVGSLIIHNNLVMGNCGEGGGDNSVVAVKVTPGAKNPEPVFTIDKTIAPYVPTVIARGDWAFLWSDKGIVSCVHLPDGKKIWQQRIGGNFSSSPIIVGEQLLNVSTDGEVVILTAGPDYKLQGRNKLGEGTRASPAFAGGMLYIRTESRLFAVRGKK